MMISHTMINLVRMKIELRERSNPAEAAEMQTKFDDLLGQLAGIEHEMRRMLLDEDEVYGKG
jgi:hypothetical protein